MTSLIGQRLGKYIVQEEIGRGGMARVYRARDSQLQRTVALKVLAPQLALDNEFIKRFEREAVIAANLQHPNIVTIYDVSEHEGLRCIAMEYIQGRTLHAILQERGALGLPYAIPIIQAVGAALDYAHTQGLVHRDIKPHNIMVSVDGRILLTDFGIAQAPEARDGQRLTRTGIFMGTPEYISPEQASAQLVDGRSDLYSLAITAFEIITGQVPFSGATPQLMLAHLQTPPPALSSVDPSQPPELDLVLARALSKSPDRRYPSGAEFVAALRNVARSYQLHEATLSDLAALVAPPSSEGQSTLVVNQDSTARGNVVPSGARRPSPAVPNQRPQPVPTQPRNPAPPAVSQPRPAATRPRSTAAAPRQPIRINWQDWRIMVPAGVLGLTLVLLLFRSAFGTPEPFPQPTPTVSPRPTDLQLTVVPLATAVPTAAPTEPPTATATETALPPTEEPTTIVEPSPTRVVPSLVPPPPTRIPPTPEPPTPEPPTLEPTATETATPDIPTLPPPTDVPPSPTPETYPPPETPVTPTETPVTPTETPTTAP